MFTIKHVESNGAESIRQTPWVSKNFSESGAEQIYCPALDRVGETDTFCNGDVYVMNDNGKTVAVYHLGTPKKSD